MGADHLYERLRLWTPNGWIEVPIRVTYSRDGPHHLELIEGPEQSFYDSRTMIDPRHLGLWTDDFGSEVDR